MDDILKKLDSIIAGKPLPKPPATAGGSSYDPIFEEAAAQYDLDPNLLRAMTDQESAFKPNAKSHKGASGLMQLMPDTARYLGVKDIWNPRENIFGGAKYMREQLDTFGGDVSLALAAYNAGPGAVKKYGNKIPPYNETQDYVKKIMANYQGSGRLKASPGILAKLDGILGAAPAGPATANDLLGKLDRIVGTTSPTPTNPTGAYTPVNKTPTFVEAPSGPVNVPPIDQTDLPPVASRPSDRPVLQAKQDRKIQPVQPKPTQAVASEPVIGEAEEDYGTAVDQGVYVQDHSTIVKRGTESGDILKTITVEYQPGQESRPYTARRAAEAMAADFDLTADQINQLASRLASHPLMSKGAGSKGDQYLVSKSDIAAVKGEKELETDLHLREQQVLGKFEELPPEALFAPEGAESLGQGMVTDLFTYDPMPAVTGTPLDLAPEIIKTQQNLTAGLVGSGGRVWESLAGIYRTAQDLWRQPFGDGTNRFINPTKPEDIKAYRGDDVYEYMRSVAGSAQEPGQALVKRDGTKAEIFQMAGGLPGDLSRIMLLSRLPGGIVTGMSADMATQAMGRGESVDQAGKEAIKGALLGSIARYAPSVGREVAAKTGSRVLGGASVLATTAAPTYATSRAFGADAKTALKETLFNTIFAMLDAAPVLTGKKIRVKDTEGNEVAVEIKQDGTVEEIQLPKEQPADVEVLDSQAAEGVRKYESQREQASEVLYTERQRPIIDRLNEAEFTVEKGGDVVAANPQAISVLNDAFVKMTGKEDFTGFHGLPIGRGDLGVFIRTLEGMREGASAEEVTAINSFIGKLNDTGKRMSGEAALFANYKDLPEYTAGTRSEELGHVMNRRAGILQVEEALSPLPGMQKLLSSLNEVYSDRAAGVKLDEAIAQSFRPDAEAHLNLSKQEIRQSQQELYRALEAIEGFDEVRYAESLRGTGRRGEVLARYARQKQRSRISGERGVEADTRGTDAVDPSLRDVQETQGERAGDSSGPVGRDTSGEPQRGDLQEGVRAETELSQPQSLTSKFKEEQFEPDDFVTPRNASTPDGSSPSVWIIDKVVGDQAYVHDAFSSGDTAIIPVAELEMYQKMGKGVEEPPLWTEEVDLFEGGDVPDVGRLTEGVDYLTGKSTEPTPQVEPAKSPLTEERRAYLTSILDGKDPEIVTQKVGNQDVKFLKNNKAKIMLQPDDVPFVEQAMADRGFDPLFAQVFKDNKIFDRKVRTEIKEFVDEDFPQLFSLLRRKSTGTPLVTDPNTAAAERIQAARGMDETGFFRDKVDQLVKLYQSFKRQFKEIDPNESVQMARAGDSFRLLSSLNGWAKIQATNDVARITEGLTREQYDVFEKVLILRDKQQAVEKGMKPGHGYADLAEVEASLKEYERAAAADPDIAKALGERENLRYQTVKGLVDIGMLGEEALENTRYFHRQVPQEAETNMFLSLGSRDVRNRKKGFEKKRTGEGDDYNTNYVESEVEWISQAHAQIRKQELLNEIKRAVDVADAVKLEAKILGQDWKSLIPSDHRIWQPKEGSYFYEAMSVPDAIINQTMQNGLLPAMQSSDLKSVLARGMRKPEWVLPKGVAALMDDFHTRIDDLPHANLYSNAQAAWKQWMLINPKNYASYNLRNFISDLDAAMAYPGIIKELPQAIKDIYGYSRSKNHPSHVEIEQAIKDGVMDSGMTFAEIPDISKLGALKMFADTDENILSRGMNKIWEAMKGTTNARENWIRLAAYRHLKKRIEAGESIYGASTPMQVEALTPGRQAAKVARELVGDYGGISEAGRAIRKHAIPFYSWLEINAPRYVRLLKNIPAESKANSRSMGPRLGGRVVFDGVKLTAKLAAITAGINAWNYIMFPDLEDELKRTDIGKRPHLIVGRNPDGSARVFQADTALRDALDWFDAGDALSDVYQLRTGQATAGDKLAEAVKAPVNRVVQGVGPLKTAGELVVGRSIFPSVFEKGTSIEWKSRAIKDRAEHLAQALAVKGIYQRVMGRPVPPSSGPVGQLSDWFLTMRVDPKESIFWYMKGKVQDYKKKIGKASPGNDPTEKSSTLFYYKQALRWGDEVAADRFLRQYKEEFGGTNKGLKASMKRTHPLGSLAKRDWDDFRASLTPEEVEMLDIAIQYFEGNLNGEPNK